MPKRNFSGSGSDIMAVFVMLVLLPFLMSNSMAFTIADHPTIAKPGCLEKCGGVSIPYPFGIGSNCSLMEGFEVECNKTSDGTYTPFMFTVKLLNISLTFGEVRLNNPISSQCYNTGSIVWDWQLVPPFEFNNKNKFTVFGCNTLAFVDLYGNKGGNLGGCVSGCFNNSINLVNGPCTGIGCCQTTIPKGTNHYNVSFDESFNNSVIYEFSPCGYAVLMEDDNFEFKTSYITTDELQNQDGMPVVLDWTVGNETCENARLNKSSYACISDKSICVDSSNDTLGYLCNCTSGFQGNPYLTGGCRDIDECADKSTCKGNGNCKNTVGSYECSCRGLFYSKGANGCEKQKWVLWIGILLGLMVLLLCFFLIHMVYQRKKVARIKNGYVQQYGVMLLLDEMKSRHGHAFKLFSEEELKEATNNFNDNTILGEGGNGTVYKGTLKNNETVAIKKCKTINERQKKEFGKEMLILSEINHKNIVRILGCCLQVEIPILVYEFIPKGTLFDLIHGKRSFPISLNTRVRIALEAAQALAYLHSWATLSIVHRDVKSANILLDEELMAKVSDFGASVIAPTNGLDEFATMIQGTGGYLDPEYIRSGQLTVKSDVYSFGVVLLELLTRKKALTFEGPEEDRILSSRFLSLMKEHKLEEILDTDITNDENMDLINEIAKLAKSCLQMEGEKRPEMKEVAEELDRARKSMNHPWGEENLEERKSLLARGESSKSHEIEMTIPYSLETRAMLGSGR